MKKTLVILLLALFPILTFLGGYLKILVSNDLYGVLCILSLGVSVPLILKSLHALVFKRDFVEENIPNTKNYSWVTMMSIIFFGPVIFSFPIAVGVPSIIHSFLAVQGAMIVTVESKPESFSYGGCEGKVFLSEYDYIFNNSICGIQFYDWKGIEVGEEIKFFGSKSKLGFKVDSYQRLINRSGGRNKVVRML